MHNQIRNIALLSVLFAFGCGQAEQQQGWQQGNQQRQQRTPSVESVEVLFGTLPLEERLAGTVRARIQSEIYPELSGPVVEIYAQDGQFVSAGDPLVRLRSTEIEERLRQAESGLEVAEARVRQSETNLERLQTNLNRLETLAERGLTSMTDLDNARADVASARADLDLIRAQRDQAASQINERRMELGHTVVRAPITGMVGNMAAEIGQNVNTGTRLAVIGDPSAMRVRVTLTERMLTYITAGTNVHIVSELAPDNVIQASISRVSPFLNPVTHSTEAEIDIEDHQDFLRPGMFVTVDVLYGESSLAALIPNAAIYRDPRDGREGVYVTRRSELLEAHGMVDDDLVDGEELLRLSFQDAETFPVEFVPVNVVARGRMLSGVTGVEPGDWVVTMGHRMLSSRNAPAAIIQPTPWDHIMNLQQMQSRDLLNIIVERVASRDFGG